MRLRERAFALFAATSVLAPGMVVHAQSIAVRWNQVALQAVALNPPSPTASTWRLHVLSTAMYDAWTAYDGRAVGYVTGTDLKRFRHWHAEPAADSDLALVDAVGSGGGGGHLPPLWRHPLHGRQPARPGAGTACRAAGLGLRAPVLGRRCRGARIRRSLQDEGEPQPGPSPDPAGRARRRYPTGPRSVDRAVVVLGALDVVLAVKRPSADVTPGHSRPARARCRPRRSSRPAAPR